MSISVDSVGGPVSQTASIGIQDFLKILTAQMNSQDPLKPVDNQEFVAQIAQFATLEQSRQLNQKLDGLLSVQTSVQSLGVLGKTVDVRYQGQLLSGRVSALSMLNGVPALTLTTPAGQFQDGIPLSALVTIR